MHWKDILSSSYRWYRDPKHFCEEFPFFKRQNIRMKYIFWIMILFITNFFKLQSDWLWILYFSEKQKKNFLKDEKYLHILIKHFHSNLWFYNKYKNFIWQCSLATVNSIYSKNIRKYIPYLLRRNFCLIGYIW